MSARSRAKVAAFAVAALGMGAIGWWVVIWHAEWYLAACGTIGVIALADDLLHRAPPPAAPVARVRTGADVVVDRGGRAVRRRWWRRSAG